MKMVVHSVYRLQRRLALGREDVIVTLSDYKRQSGLLMSTLLPCVIGCHAVIFPFICSKQKPELWVETASNLAATIVAGSSKELGGANPAEIIDEYDQRRRRYPDLSSIRATIVTDGCSPWAVTYTVSVGAQLAPFFFNIGSICPLVWSELGGAVALRDPRNDLLSLPFSREYLSFGVVREKAALEPDAHAILVYQNGPPLPGLDMAVVKPVKQPFDEGARGDDQLKLNASLQLSQSDEIGEIILSGDALDHQSFLSLENVGDRVFRCQVSYKATEMRATLSKFVCRLIS